MMIKLDSGGPSEDFSDHPPSDDKLPTEEDGGEAGGAPALAKRETNTVRKMRLLVAIVLLSCALAASLSVYFYIRESEQDEFRNQFQDDAHKVVAALGRTIQSTLTAVDSLVVSLVSLVEATDQTWPFVVIPDFAVRAKKVRALSEAVVLNMYQIVSEENRLDWEEFAATYNQWVDHDLDIQEADPTYTGPIYRNYTNVDYIFGYGEEEIEGGTNRTGPFAVWWHSYPQVTSSPPYNWDLMSSIHDGRNLTMFEHQLVEINSAYLIAEPDDYELQEENEIEATFYKDLIEPGQEPMEPISDILYPIFLEANQKANFFYDSPDEIQQYQMVSILAASIYWRDFLKNILPNGSNGILAVFENECNPTFTYRIDGPETTFIGTVDAHETKYNDLAQRHVVSDLAQQAIDKTFYSGVPINHDKCPFTVTIYPSSDMEERFVSGDATLIAIIVASTFVFTSLIFVLYDFWVERRQKVVMTSANQTNAIVTQLFPSNVRERMLQPRPSSVEVSQTAATAAEKLNNNSSSNKPEQSKSTTTKLFGGGGGMDRHGFKFSTTDSTIVQGAPIADLFQNATVIFADIVGFTSWSSTRSPSEVFQLLETIYGAFDAIALRHRVFKIETIGDCYVAVTGLPNPQKQHATIMAKFAWKCLKDMNKVTAELEKTLGPGTSSLELRVGLHSGPVTAGVLRGKKARFQLFGDTVNTASRMESTGKPTHIQVSQSTADALTACGKGSWLQVRPDVVHVKGKGEMQTYWLVIREGGSTYASSLDDSLDHCSLGEDDESQRSVRPSHSPSKVVVESFDSESNLPGMDAYVDL